MIRDDNGKVVGFGAVDPFRHPLYKGKRVVEIAKLTVLPEARGKKLSYELADRLIEKSKTQWPDGIFIVTTKTPEVKKVFGSKGFKSAGMIKADVLFGFPQSKSHTERRERIEALGWDVMVGNFSPEDIDLADLKAESVAGRIFSITRGVNQRVSDVLGWLKNRFTS